MQYSITAFELIFFFFFTTSNSYVNLNLMRTPNLAKLGCTILYSFDEFGY